MSLLDENIYETTGFDVVVQKLCESLSHAGFSQSENCYFKTFKYSELFGELPKYYFDNLYHCRILFEEEQIFLKISQDPICYLCYKNKLIEYNMPGFCYSICIKLYQCRRIDDIINIIKNIIIREEEKCIKKNIKILCNN